MAATVIGAPLTAASLMDAADARGRFALDPAARARIAAARAAVDARAASPEPVYGLNTGLGANLGHRVAPGAMAAFQVQILRGRAAGVGPPLPERICRAALLARVAGAARGACALSPATVDAMLAMLERGLAPAIPRHGSIGAGDLLLGAHVGLALIGEGEVWAGGRPRPASEALAEAGLAPATLGPGEALALASHSAVTVALSACATTRAQGLLTLAMGVAALSAEGHAINPAILDPRIPPLRPAAGQERAADWLRAALSGSSLLREPPRSLQDALSFRTMAPALGAARAALDRLTAAVEIELNGAADSPAVIAADPPVLLSAPNFDTTDVALALDAAAIALARLAGASAQRIVKLMAPHLSGLPRHLSPVGGASAGMVPLQKTAAALLAEVQRHAAPTPTAMAVSEMVEDVAPMTPLAARKLDEQCEAWRLLIGVEALVAAQAVDLRAPASLGVVAERLHAPIRAAHAPGLRAKRIAAVGTGAAGMRAAMPEVRVAPLKVTPGSARPKPSSAKAATPAGMAPSAAASAGEAKPARIEPIMPAGRSAATGACARPGA